MPKRKRLCAYDVLAMIRETIISRAQEFSHRAASPFRLLAVVIFITLQITPVTAAEYEAEAVKAAFLHRFAAYVEWPNLPPPDAPFTIGVVDDEHGLIRHLQRLLPGLTIHGRRAQVRSVSTAAELDSVQILYIGPADATRTGALLGAAASRPVLIVTDHPEGLAHGGVINFVQVSRNVRFEISLTQARRHGLQINAGLLSVAVRVEDGPRSDRGGDADTVRLAQGARIRRWRRS